MHIFHCFVKGDTFAYTCTLYVLHRNYWASLLAPDDGRRPNHWCRWGCFSRYGGGGVMYTAKICRCESTCLSFRVGVGRHLYRRVSVSVRNSPLGLLRVRVWCGNSLFESSRGGGRSSTYCVETARGLDDPLVVLQLNEAVLFEEVKS